MHHTSVPVSTGVDDAGAEALRAVLDGLHRLTDADGHRSRPDAAEVRAVVDGAWSALAAVLDDEPQAGAVLDLLRQLTVADEALKRVTETPRQLGEVLKRLESAPSRVADLVRMAPQLTSHLGFDRAIFSRIVDGVWISEAVHIADDPQWADEINRVGQSQPQPLVPGLRETEIVRRREAMIVTDVQTDSRVHRPIADASRSRSYVAAPILSGNRVVGLLHADCFLQGRDPDAAECEALAAYAKGLQLALSRAHLAEGLQTVGSVLKSTANESQNRADSVGEFSLEPPGPDSGAGHELALASGVTKRALLSVRDMLTAREIQILELMAEGRSNAGIGAQLVISEGTVKQHVKHILRKLRAGNRVEAVSMLYQSDGV